MVKKIFLILIFFQSIFFSKISFADVSIIVKIDDEIITNYDVKRESNYLMILNPNLENLYDKKIFELAKTSLIKEIIKKKEIKKFSNLGDKNEFLDQYLENLYSKLNFNNENEFIEELKKNDNYDLYQIKQKINAELLWNELIFLKFKNQLNIKDDLIKAKIDKLEGKDQKEFFLSEIVFNKKKDIALENLIDEIKLSINEIGFNNTANIYSVSESAKFGGKVGWVKENSLSKLIYEKLNNLEEGKYTDVIKLSNSFLILRIDQVRINKIEIDKNIEYQKLVQSETNKQLNKFSRIYFDKSKINYTINEN
jgi:peptidyl-prolyl cis-trans isomerase SurA